MKMISRKKTLKVLILVLILIAFYFTKDKVSSSLSVKDSTSKSDDEIIQKYKPQSNNRKIASLQKDVPTSQFKNSNAEIKKTMLEHNQFNTVTSYPEIYEKNPSTTYKEKYHEQLEEESFPEQFNSPKPLSSRGMASRAKEEIFPMSGGYRKKLPIKKIEEPTPIRLIVASSSGSFIGSSETSTCAPNFISGSFNGPISVALSCTIASAIIKYCFTIDMGDGCCDPQTSGTTYTSRIIIGQTDANYCLSFYGETAVGSTEIYKNTYKINSHLPNLQVAHPQVNYQTTQLNGKSLITSSDFGKLGYDIGQVNLKTHDPGTQSCEDIITNYVTYPFPTPATIISFLDTSLDSPSIQIEIPLKLNQLDYGENFIISYITNTNFAMPLYSCATTKIVLEDFNYFQEVLAFGDPGTNTVREFSGGLSPYGFFEQDSFIYRGPAGEDSQDLSGQKLEYGMFGIIY